MPTTSKCSLVSCHLVDTVWGMVTYGLEHACLKTGGDIGSDYLWSECRSGAAYLFVVTDGEQVIGAGVWRFEKWASGRKYRCLCAYGERMAEWADDMRELVERAAKAGGATSLVMEGRRGWGRRYPEARLLRNTYEVDL